LTYGVRAGLRPAVDIDQYGNLEGMLSLIGVPLPLWLQPFYALAGLAVLALGLRHWLTHRSSTATRNRTSLARLALADEVVEASEAATGCEVVEVIGDCAYGAGETRAEFAEAGRTVVAKVPEIQNQGYFARTEFQIDLEAGTWTCPN
jgi:hypothetical protein